MVIMAMFDGIGLRISFARASVYRVVMWTCIRLSPRRWSLYQPTTPKSRNDSYADAETHSATHTET